MRKRLLAARATLCLGLCLIFMLPVACSSDGTQSLGGDSDSVDLGDGDVPGDGDLGGDGDVVTIGGAVTACAGQCVDTQTDPAHCGGCGAICVAGTQCKSGACVGCAVGQTECNGVCVDTATDRNNCGVCGTACNLGANCAGGACETCTEGQTECGGNCVDLLNNPQNCGACGTVCSGTSVCAAGACVENTCGGANERPCGPGGACVDVNNNNEHCGTCGQECPAFSLASGGSAPPLQCKPGEEGGISRCGCYSGQPCGEYCVQTNSDPKNCGGCGIECHAAQYCDNGSCSCGGGQVLCNGACKSADQCGTGGGVGARVSPPEFSLPGRELQVAGAPPAGDGSVDCTPDPISSGTGGGSTGTGGTGGGTVGNNPDAGAHCGGDTWIQGKSTWYELATPLVHCSYDTTTLPAYYGAINDAQYAVGDVCGACVEIEANGKTLEVQIVDECPYVGNETWCYAGSNHIDLNPAAFEYFEPRVTGVFDMRWRYVPCSDPGQLEYTFKQGSSIYWTGVMIRNHPIPLASVEVAGPDGTFKQLVRQEYNFWLLETGFGVGPYTLRVTDTSGAVVELANVPTLPSTELGANETQVAGTQLSSCQ